MNWSFRHRAVSEIVLRALLVGTASMWPTGVAFGRNSAEDYKYLIPIVIFVLIWLAFFALIQSLRGKPTTKLHFLFSLWLAPLTFGLFLDPIRNVMDSTQFTTPEIRERPLPNLPDMSPAPARQTRDPALSDTQSAAPNVRLSQARAASINKIRNAAMCYALWETMLEIQNCQDCNKELQGLPAEALRKASAVQNAQPVRNLESLSQAAKDAAVRYGFEMPSEQIESEERERPLLPMVLAELSINAAKSRIDELIEQGDSRALSTKAVICALGYTEYLQPY